jgi:hypothetical protein
MSKGCWNESVQCPFYIKDDAIKITCEGFVQGSFLTMRFPNKEEKLKQRKIFCEKGYKCCEIYRMLISDKYQE